jgi:beta-glucosidase
MRIDRGSMIASTLAASAAPAFAAAPKTKAFPRGFLWGAATAGHQVEGNNIASDLWLLENIKPTVFAEPSGDAVNSFELWPVDLDIVKQLGLNSYRFSIEWSRIEPEQGLISIAMLDHYKAIIEGCRARGLTPLVTFNHFTTPRWFAALGGWSNADAPSLFAAFCDRAARHLASGIGYAMTLNEPNLAGLLQTFLPPPLFAADQAMLDAAAKKLGVPKYLSGNTLNLGPAEFERLIEAHKAGRAAIKAVRSDLPVGVTLAMFDDQAVGKNSVRDQMRQKLYGRWLEAAKGDDFLGVQNYERTVWDDKGKVPPPANSVRNWGGAEVYAPSLAGAVRYAHSVTKLPIIVTEHGVGTPDDRIRAELIPAALTALKAAIDDGVPVKGYVHWSLLDNFEWIFGYKPTFGLVAVDRTTFKRMPKPSAAIYGAIARANSL